MSAEENSIAKTDASFRRSGYNWTMFQSPLVSKHAIIATYQPGAPITSDAPLRTLKRNNSISDGLRFIVRDERGKVSGQLSLYSSLNEEAARFRRLGWEEHALSCAEAASEVEASEPAKKIVSAFSDITHPANLSDPYQVYLYALQEESFKELAIELAIETSRAWRQLKVPTLVRTLSCHVVRIDELMGQIKSEEGIHISLPKKSLQEVGCDVVGIPVIAQVETIGATMLTVVTPALVSEQEMPEEDKTPFPATQEFFNRVKSEVPLEKYLEDELKVELIQKPHGKSTCCCPFHAEGTPSFVVYPGDGTERNKWSRWHCYGACQESGTVIDAVMRAEGFSDPYEAAKHLANLYNIKVTEDSGYAEFRRNIEMLNHQIETYHQALISPPTSTKNHTLEYLKGQGIADVTIKHFQLGADNSRQIERLAIPIFDKAGHPTTLTTRSLYESWPCGECGQEVTAKEMVRARFNDAKAERKGLPRTDWKKCPHCHASGAVAKLSWLVTQFPKYLFQSTFDKSKVLYHEPKARKYLTRDKTLKGLYLTEGYSDAWAAWQSSCLSVCAYSGSVLSDYQASSAAALAIRANRPIILVPDFDETGKMSVSSNIKKLYQQDPSLQVLVVSGIEEGSKDLAHLLINFGEDIVKKTLTENLWDASEWEIRQAINAKSLRDGSPIYSVGMQMNLVAEILLTKRGDIDLSHLIPILTEHWQCAEKDVIELFEHYS